MRQSGEPGKRPLDRVVLKIGPPIKLPDKVCGDLGLFGERRKNDIGMDALRGIPFESEEDGNLHPLAASCDHIDLFRKDRLLGVIGHRQEIQAIVDAFEVFRHESMVFTVIVKVSREPIVFWWR
ncbi:MAG: hypothetical protein CMJ18_25280 [Phycisphaeraceae bacterium]|nr:hypothetical protein [Phycisphaeraceae bacterium]